MLETARFHNFTAAPNGEWRFAPGLNVIVGENGVGKSHVLKAIYALLKVQSGAGDLARSTLEKACADKLMAVMRPESLGRLVKRRQGRERCEIELRIGGAGSADMSIAFATNAKSQVDVVKAPAARLSRTPVYLPTRELATLCPWFVSLYDNYHVEFEETWRDTVSLLGAPTLKGAREKRIARLLEPLERAMGGSVSVDAMTGRFYLQAQGGRMEIALVAEGLRKLATIARLASTGVLLDQGFLFWDEPESNLNPKLINTIAASIVELAAEGLQVFIATHSLFLLREIEMLTSPTARRGLTCRYFALADAGGDVVLEQGDAVDELRTLVLLDEELAQSDRFIDLEAR